MIPISNFTFRELDRMFNPQSIAVVGANDNPQRVGYNLLENIIKGGYRGKIYPVNPRYREILGHKVYADLAELPHPVDLVVLAVNQERTVEQAEICARQGAGGIICISGGFREMGGRGAELEHRLAAIGSNYHLPIVGPNTLGIVNNHASLHSVFQPLGLNKKGNISFITQSGGVGVTMAVRAAERELGISKWVGMGNSCFLEPADYLSYLAEDPHTRVIGVFIEGSAHARRFIETAREVSKKKPVIVYKIGRTNAVDRLTRSHTGAMAGSYKIYEGAFRQYCVISASHVAELVAACQSLSVSPLPQGNRVGIVTITAGPSIVIAEELSKTACKIPPLQPETLTEVKNIMGQEPTVILQNPLDVSVFGALAEDFGKMVGCVLRDPGVDLVIAIFTKHPHWRLPTAELAALQGQYNKPLIACFIGTADEIKEDREYLRRCGVPAYNYPEEAAWGAASLVQRSIYLKRLTGERKVNQRCTGSY